MRVALCLSGLCIGFKEAYESVKKFWIDPFETDVFIHTYDTLATRHWEIPCHSSDFADMQSMYHPVKMVVQSWEKMRPAFVTTKYDAVKNHGSNVTSALSMFYNVQECNRLKSEYENLLGFRYDLVIRSRLDILFNSANENAYLNAKDTEVYIPWRDGGGNPTGDKSPFLYGGLNDQFAIGSSVVMDKYSSMYDNIDVQIHAGVSFHPESLLKMHIIRQSINPIGIDVDYKFLMLPRDYELSDRKVR